MGYLFLVDLPKLDLQNNNKDTLTHEATNIGRQFKEVV